MYIYMYAYIERERGMFIYIYIYIYTYIASLMTRGVWGIPLVKITIIEIAPNVALSIALCN